MWISDANYRVAVERQAKAWESTYGILERLFDRLRDVEIKRRTIILQALDSTVGPMIRCEVLVTCIMVPEMLMPTLKYFFEHDCDLQHHVLYSLQIADQKTLSEQVPACHQGPLKCLTR